MRSGTQWKAPGIALRHPLVPAAVEASGHALTRQVGMLLAVLFGVVLFVAVVGEWLGGSSASPSACRGRSGWR